MKTKKLFAALMAFMSIFYVNAQDVLMATLQHGDEMTPYYGADAVKDAVAAASEGDVISVSGGTFNSPVIDKPLIIQGSGYVQDVPNHRYRTLLVGELNITLPESDKKLLLEGLYVKDNTHLSGILKGAQIKHCLFRNNLTFLDSHENTFLLHNRIYILSLTGRSVNASISNNIIENFGGSNDTKEKGLCRNNVIALVKNTVKSFEFKNNVIGQLESTATSIFNSYFYNLYSGKYPGYNQNELRIPWECKQYANTFFRSNLDGLREFYDYNNNEMFYYQNKAQLKINFADIKGEDGTEVGIYGGDTPFSEYPDNPRVTSSYVSPQTDENNKISVRFTIESAQ